MSAYTHSGLINIKKEEKELDLPYLSCVPQKDVKILSTMSKKELLALCEDDTYVYDLCNKTPALYNIVTSPSSLL